jgi:hypothetical protein
MFFLQVIFGGILAEFQSKKPASRLALYFNKNFYLSMVGTGPGPSRLLISNVKPTAVLC